MGMKLDEIPRYQELLTAENDSNQKPVKTKMKFSILSRMKMRKSKIKTEESQQLTQQQQEESDAAPISTADEDALMLQ